MSSRAGIARRTRAKTSTTAVHPLDRPEVRHVNQERLAVRREPLAQVRSRRRADSVAQSMKFGMTRMSQRHAELAVGVGREALGHGRHAVRLLDAERDDLRVRRIAAEQRDVGAVQRRDHARHVAALARREHLPRQVRRGRVRNRVVRVHDVEPLVARRPARSCSRATAGTAARGTADSSASRRGGTTGRAGSRRGGPACRC